MEALLTRRFPAALALGAALLALALPSSAAGPLATIKGRIVNDKGAPITGAYLYVSTPEGLGLTNFITSKTGRYHIVGLMRGKYTVIVEAPGFKTVRIDGVTLSAGSTVTLNFKMQPTAIEEETITLPPGPTLNRDSPVTTVVLGKSLISRLPMARDFTGILGLVPGLAYEIDSPGLPKSIQGEPALSNQLEQDGISVTNPINASEMGRINIDIVDEVVIETAGHAADSGPVQGGYLAVIFPPGTASTDMELSYGVSGKGLVNSLWTDQELAEMPGATPTTLRREHDLSFTLGGPVLEEMAWFYGNLRFKSQGRRAPYSYWTDPLGVRHFVYDYMEKDLGGLFKLTMSVVEKFKGALEVGFSGVREPVYSGDIATLRPEAATRELDGERLTYARAAGSYIVNQATRVTMSLGYAKQRLPLRLNSMATEKPEFYDVITGRSWGSGTLNDYRTSKRARVSASLTRFLDGFLGFPHELSLGGDYETTTGVSSTWKADNLVHYYADGSPYTYGQTTSPSSGNTVGWGLVGFYIAPSAEGSLTVRSELKRLGGYVQDTVKLFDRVSLSAGFRFDRSEARLGSLTKAESGNALSIQLGASLIDPVMGYNPYNAMSLPAWDKNIVWNSISPRVGLVVDILGRGATLLKASWARLPEYLGLGYSEDLSQVDPRAAHAFLWFDENADGKVTSADAFSLVSYDFRVYKSEFYSQSIDPKLSAPVIEEFSAGLEQQLARDFTLSARYTVRTHANNIGHTLFDPSTGVSWARLEDSPEGSRDRLFPRDLGPLVLRADRERARARGAIQERGVHLPEADVEQLAALRLRRLEPVDGHDQPGLPLERRHQRRPPDAELLHEHRRDRHPPPGPALHRPARRDGPLPWRHLREPLPEGPERSAMGADRDHHPAVRLGGGERRQGPADQDLSGGTGWAALRLLEEPGHPAGEGVPEGGTPDLQHLGRRPKPPRRQVSDTRPQRRGDLAPRRRGLQHGHADPERHLQYVLAGVGVAGDPVQLQARFLAGTRRSSSAPALPSCS